MTNKQLFNGINSADDKFIIEALEDDAYLYSDVEKKHRFSGVLKVALPCAACAALIFGVLVGGRYFNGINPVSSAEGNTASDISVDSSDVSTETSDNISEDSYVYDHTLPVPIDWMPLVEPITPDPATFWEGELPVLPVKEFENHSFELSLNRKSGSAEYCLSTERGAAVYAVADGEVYFVGELSIEQGMCIIIKHNDNLYTTYEIIDIDCGIPVKVGDTVKAGQVIGYAGLLINFDAEHVVSAFSNGIGYNVDTRDPLDEQYIKDAENLKKWKNSGLSKPLDNMEDDFDFLRVSALISRNEPVIPAPQGANVYAVDSGEVIKAIDFGNGLGYVVGIEHNYENEKFGILSYYYHLGSDLTVKVGDTVEKGDVIGHISGSSLSGVSGLGYCTESLASRRIIFPGKTIR